MDRIRLASGKALRSQALSRGLPQPVYDAPTLAGAIALTNLGIPLISTGRAVGSPEWCQIVTRSSDFLGVPIGISSNTASVAGYVGFIRSRGTATAGAAVANGDTLGQWTWAGVSPTSTQETVGIVRMVMDGTVAANSMPTRYEILTTPAGSYIPLVRVIISSGGNVLIGNTTGTQKLSVTGNIQITNTNGYFMVGNVQVLGSRRTGWAASTGTATRTAFATSTATVSEVAERLKALIDDLISHGAIGA